MTIVISALILAAVISALLWRWDDDMDDARSDPAVRVVDARTGRPIPPAIQANRPDISSGTKGADTHPRDVPLVHALAARGAGDMPMLAEVVGMQDRAPDDDVAEARAMQLVSRHLRLAAAGHPLQVRCAAALCEVTGTIASPASAIEAPALLEAVLAAGWTPGPAASAPAGDGTTDFLLYLNRES
jgi:hypothetical protein